MGQVVDRFLSAQRGSSPSSGAPTSTSAVATPDESAAPAELVGRLAPLAETLPSMLAAGTCRGNGPPAESVGGAAGRYGLPVGAGMSSAAPAPDGRASSAASAEEVARQPASPEGAMGSAPEGEMSEGVDRAEVPGVKDGTVHKANTAPTPEPMSPDTDTFTGNFG